MQVPALRAIATATTLFCLGTSGCGSDAKPAPDAAIVPNADAAAGPDLASMAPNCVANVGRIWFTPMYSAFDGAHTFQVPAIAALPGVNLVWSSSDPSKVDFQKDPMTGGVLITTLAAGEVEIAVNADGVFCGTSRLSISAATPAEWAAGDARYNNGIVIDRGGSPTGTPRAACTNCHGPTAAGEYRTVSHTPTQTAGFSDEELIGIFEGRWPERAGVTPFDPEIATLEQWQAFHKWQMTPEEAKGVIVYLRSLTPAPQTGKRDFGGQARPDAATD